MDIALICYAAKIETQQLKYVSKLTQ